MTTPNNEPTMGEVLRRLDEVSRQLLDLAGQMRDDRDKAAATFVRQDVYQAQRIADQAVVADLNGDIRAVNKARESDAGFRRQVWLTMGALAITTLVTIVIAILNFVGR